MRDWRSQPLELLALRSHLLRLAIGALIVSGAGTGALAQKEDAWRPYRPTKLTQPDENMRFLRSDLGVEPQEFPNPKRTPAAPGKLKSPPQETPPPRTVIPEEEPSRPAARNAESPAGFDDLPEARPASPLESVYPETNEYVDEFDLLSPEESMFLDEGVLTGPPKLTKYKDGFFQKLNIQGTNLDPGYSSGFAVTEFESALTLAVPAPTTDFPLLITPMFDVRTLAGPVSPDVPPTLYTTGIDFMWVPKVNDRLRGAFSVAPMIFSDFQRQDADMFRLTGRGIVQWDAIPDRLQVVAGVLYLNRDDVRILPVAGLIWNPNDYWNLELIFPRPKIARVINYGADYSDWFYFLGEFGGNTWSVRRDDDTQDKVTLRDMRAMLGIERRRSGGMNYRFEVGYVFAREVDYLATDGAEFTAADTVLLRIGATF